MAAKKNTIPKKAFTKAELTYVTKNMGVKTPEEIAAHLGRKVEGIVRLITRLTTPAETVSPDTEQASDDNKVLKDLHNSPSWRNLKEKFTNTELRFYEEQWCLLMSQFGLDVVPTERLQANQLITYMILMDRNLSSQKDTRTSIEQSQRRLDYLSVLYPETEDGSRPAHVITESENLISNIATMSDRITQLSREFKDLDTNQQKMLEGLKATRNQRLERLSERAKSMLDLIKELLHEEQRESKGRQAELYRQATLKKAAELAEPHRFLDGTIDQPLLNSDTV